MILVGYNYLFVPEVLWQNVYREASSVDNIFINWWWRSDDAETIWVFLNIIKILNVKLLRIHFIIFFGDFINFIRLEIVTLLSDKLFEKKVFYLFIHHMSENNFLSNSKNGSRHKKHALCWDVILP